MLTLLGVVFAKRTKRHEKREKTQTRECFAALAHRGPLPEVVLLNAGSAQALIQLAEGEPGMGDAGAILLVSESEGASGVNLCASRDANDR